MTKTCSKCGEEKQVDQFSKNRKSKDGLYSSCKACNRNYYNSRKIQYSEYYKRNRDKILEYCKEYAAKNAERRREVAKKWAIENRERRLESARNWCKNNKEKRRAIERRSRKKRKSEPAYIVASAVQSSFGRLIRRGRSMRFSEYVDFTPEEFKLHMEALFQPGMTWDNYGEWHVDHIIPKSWFLFDSVEDDTVKLAWSLYNLQPLWAHDNLTKSNRYAGGGALSLPKS